MRPCVWKRYLERPGADVLGISFTAPHLVEVEFKCAFLLVLERAMKREDSDIEGALFEGRPLQKHE